MRVTAGGGYPSARIHGTLVSPSQSHYWSSFVVPRRLSVRYNALNSGGCKKFRCNRILLTLTHSPMLTFVVALVLAVVRSKFTASMTVVIRGRFVSCLSSRVNGPT